MRRSKSETLDTLIGEFLRQEGLESPLNQYRLVDSWPKVVGPTIARYTGEVFIKNQTLFVKVKSAPLRNDLMMGRTNLVRQLNQHIGAQVISDIVFY